MENSFNHVEGEVDILEKIKKEMLEQVSRAEANPISIDRCGEIEERFRQLTDAFVSRGTATPEEQSEEDNLLTEIMEHSAISKNLTEYRELLNQIALKYGLGEEWARGMLAHENAHASVAEQQGAIWKGYGVIFIKDESGELSNLQPLNFIKTNPDWGVRQTIINSIEGTRAPLDYGERLSEGDIEDIRLNQERLNRIG